MENIGQVGKKTIGNATFETDSLLKLTDPRFQNDYFYAVSYEWNGQTVIAYRGTDDVPGGANDIWSGWLVGAGYIGSGSQVDETIAFYEAVTGKKYWETDGKTILTGHSLGGGLAGFMSALSGTETYGYNYMPFGIAAWFQSFYVPTIEGTGGADTPDYDLNFKNFTGHTILGEVLALVRSGALQGLFGALVPPLGMSEAAATLYFESQLKTSMMYSDAGFESPFNLHSQALVVSLLYAKEKEHQDWREVDDPLWNAAFSDSVGAAAGFDPEKKNGQYSASGKMLAAIAYSALDEGTLVFGNTGIRAMFDDADELGALKKAGRLPDQLPGGFLWWLIGEDRLGGVVEAAVQFAGTMALHEIDYTKHKDFSPEEGIITLSKNGAIVADATQAAVLTIDLRKALWNLGGTADAEVKVEGVRTIIEEIFYDEGGDNDELMEAVKRLYGPDAEKSTHTIDRIGFGLGGEALDETLYLRGENEARYQANQAGLFVAGDGNDKVRGTGHNDIIIGGDGDDDLEGNGGKDIILGGAFNCPSLPTMEQRFWI